MIYTHNNSKILKISNSRLMASAANSKGRKFRRKKLSARVFSATVNVSYTLPLFAA